MSTVASDPQPASTEHSQGAAGARRSGQNGVLASRSLALIAFVAVFAAAWFLVAEPLLAELQPASFDPLFGQVVRMVVFVVAAAFCLLVLSRRRASQAAGERDAAAASAAIDEQTTRFTALLRSVAAPIWLKDLQGRYVACNAAFETLCGRREADILGRTDDVLFDPDQAEHLRTRDREVLEKGEPATHEETERFNANGAAVTLQIARTPITNAAGVVTAVLAVAHDVNATRRAQEALRESETKYGTLIESMADGVFVAQDFRFTFANSALPSMLGYESADEFVGLHFRDVVAPESLELWSERFRLRVGTGEEPTRHYEVLFMRKGGAERVWVELRASRSRFMGRAAVLGIVRDITQRKQAEAAMAESEERFRLAVESAPHGTLLVDGDGTIRHVNRQIERMFGWARQDLRGVAMERLLPERARARHVDLRRSFNSDPSVRSMGLGRDLFGLRSDGTEFPIEVGLSPVHTASDRFVMATIIDISERQRAAAALRESERRLAYALAATGEGVWDWDLMTNRVRHNGQWCRQLGLDDSFLEHGLEEFVELIHAEDRATVDGLLSACLRGEAAYQSEHRMRRADGSFIQVLDRGYVVERGADGAPLRMVGSFTDVTERRRVDEELRRHREHLAELVSERTQQLADANQALSTREYSLRELNEELTLARDRAEAASRAKSTFLANMSHEIRTPMNAIIGLTELMRRDTADRAHKDRLGKVSEAASHLLSIINDILDISKIEAGKLLLEQSDFAFEALLKDTCALVAERAAAKGIELVVSVDERLRGVVRGDPTRLRQAILNYLGNAVKFTERGAIVLRARFLAENATDLTVRIEVQDSGVGIAPAHLVRVFNAFEQADSSTTRKYGGTGLGLAINQRLAALMGGEVGAESAPGAGSTFWLTVRLGKASGPAETIVLPEPERAPPAQTRRDAQRFMGRRVLLAEDNPVNQDVAVELLRAYGLTVDVAPDGAQAVEMATKQPYDLILMDVQMPKMDGLEATRVLRRGPPATSTPIVAMTANAFDEDRRQCLAAGMNDHIAKPVEMRVLGAALDRWLAPRPVVPSPDAAALQLRRAFLEAVPGLKIKTGLAYVQGKLDRYEVLLRRYLVSATSDLTRLEDALDAGDRSAIAAAAHSLRGAAAVVGATAVESSAHAVEAIVRGNGSEEALGIAIAELRAAAHALASAVE